MKKSKRLCRTKATAILKYFCFRDGTFAFFYEVRKNGLVKYYVNCNKKNYGPYEEVDESHDQDYPVCSDKSSKDFIWTGKLGGINYVFKNGKKIKKERIMSDEEFVAILESLAKDEEKLPEEKYDEKTHILENKKTNNCWFVTPDKKFGPYYRISHSEYKDEKNFHFIYKKNKDDIFSFYNLNGTDRKQLYGDVFNASLFYDSKGRAFVTYLNEKFILINGEENYPLDAACQMIQYIEKNEIGKEVMVGKLCNTHINKIQYNGKTYYADYNWFFLNDESIAYSSGYSYRASWTVVKGDNSKRISAVVPGERPQLVGHIVQYERGGVTYLMIEGREYVGITDVAIDNKPGFVFVKKGHLNFYEYETPRLFGYLYHRDNLTFTDILEKELKNIEELINSGLVAGECSL